MRVATATATTAIQTLGRMRRIISSFSSDVRGVHSPGPSRATTAATMSCPETPQDAPFSLRLAFRRPDNLATASDSWSYLRCLRAPSRRLARQRERSFEALAGALGCFRQLQCGHGCKRVAPVEQATGVHANSRSELLGARSDHFDVLRLPEQQVDRVEGQVV